MKKLKSFTLSEILVAMFLSGIVVGIAFMGYVFFYKRLFIYQDRSANIVSVSTLDRLLTRDIERSLFVTCENNNLNCLMENRKIEYWFSPEWIVRRDSISMDTFHFGLNGIPFISLNDEPVHSGLIDRLNMSLFYDRDSLQFDYRKHYAAEQLINYEKIRSWMP